MPGSTHDNTDYTLRRQQSTVSDRSYTSDVFADRFAVPDMADDEQMSRGPSFPRSRRNSTQSIDDDDDLITSIAAHYADEVAEPSMPNREYRNSMRKSMAYQPNPFNEESSRPSRSGLVRQDTRGSYAPSTSDAGMPAGPSHDYGRYEQGTSLSRAGTTVSMLAPQSTGRRSLHGPAHPYNMYPQNVVDDEDNETTHGGNPSDAIIPVGFPPVITHFRHDPEDLSEQLPPYSEYPEDGAPKHVVGPSHPPGAHHLILPRQGLPPIREPQSMTDATSMADLSSPSSQTALAPPSTEPKAWKDKSWSERRRTKFFGIPFMRLCIIGGVLTFAVIVLAAVLGAYYGGQARGRDEATAGMLLDAQLANASDGPKVPLPMGTYQLRPGPPQEVQSECLPISNQAAAWSCDQAEYGALAIRVDQIPNTPNQTATIFDMTPGSTDNGTPYGALLPSNVPPTPVRWVVDRDAQYRGAAWQFQTMYQKIVIAYPDLFSSPSGSSRRMKAMKRDWIKTAKAGDKPWVCYWNETLLEVFIYPQNNSTSFRSMGNGTNSVTQNGRKGSWNSKRGEPKSSSSSSSSSSEILSATSTTSSTSTITSSATSSSTTLPYCKGFGAASTVSGVATEPSCIPSSSTYDAWSQLQLYPYVVKIEERRAPGQNEVPVCYQRQLMNDGTLQPVPNADGSPVQVTLTENGPDIGAYTSTYGAITDIEQSKAKRGMFDMDDRVTLSNKAIIRGSCHCQWMSGEL